MMIFMDNKKVFQSKDTTENITFPNLLWRVVIIALFFKGLFLVLKDVVFNAEKYKVSSLLCIW